MKKLYILLLALLSLSCSSNSSNEEEVSEEKPEKEVGLVSVEGLSLDAIQLPEGFAIEVFARVKNARTMALSPNGTLFVGNNSGNKVYAVQDVDEDWKADSKYVITEDLELPNGVAFRDGSLYVAEVASLWRFDNIESDLSNPSEPVLIYDDFPSDKHHGWKFIAFGPDGKLYVPVGAPCNICESKEEIYASISRMNPDGSDREIFAHGVRNTVGFTWHPETEEMWFTDNGRDMLGDEEPPCELNRAAEAGQHYGYPYCHAGYLKDPEFGDKFPCDDFVKPAQTLGPHVAPLGIRFCTSESFPQEYKNVAFIAEHGSWNRSKEAGHTGHKITMVREENGVGVSYEDFAVGFLNKETNRAWARPVDLLFAPDGSLLVSDDLAGTIFRIYYKG